MSEETKLAEALASALLRVQGPSQSRLWAVADVASYLVVSERHARERIVCRPGFPAPYRVFDGHPRWKACEVVAWVEQWRSAA